MKPANSNRPIEGQALTNILHELARVNVTIGSLKFDLEPLAEEDIAAGAEPLTSEQVQEELEKIAQIVTTVAIQHLKADPMEWYAANDMIE